MDLGEATPEPPGALATAGTMVQVVEHMRAHLHEPAAQLRALRSLALMLEVGPSQQAAWLQAGGHKVVVASMNQHSDNPELLCHAAVVLASVGGNPDAAKGALDADTAEVLVFAIRGCDRPGLPLAAELRAGATAALSSLCQGAGEVGLAQLAAAGCLAAVSAWMVLPRELQEDDAVAYERGCEFFAVFSGVIVSNEGNLKSAPDPLLHAREALMSSEPVGAVLAAMVCACSDADVQVAACSALAALQGVDSALRSEVCAGGGIEAVVQAMKAHSGNVGVLENGCRTLSVLTQGGDGSASAKCLAAGGAEMVVATINGGVKKGRKAAMRVGCLTLKNLAVDNASSEAVIEAKGAEAIVAALSAQPAHGTLQEAGLKTLARLACSAIGVAAVARAGGLTVTEAAERNTRLAVDPELIQALRSHASAGAERVSRALN